MKSFLPTLWIALLITVFNCQTYKPISQPSNSTLNIELAKDDYELKGLGFGGGCESYFFGYNLGGKFAYAEAYKNALLSRNGNFLIQATSDESLYAAPFIFMPIYVERCITLNGLVVDIKNLPRPVKRQE